MKLECQGVLALEFHLGGTGVYELLALCREVRDKMNVGTHSAMPYVPTLFVSELASRARRWRLAGVTDYSIVMSSMYRSQATPLPTLKAMRLPLLAIDLPVMSSVTLTQSVAVILPLY